MISACGAKREIKQSLTLRTTMTKAEQKVEIRELKAILTFFIAEFNNGNLQAMEFSTGPLMFQDSVYDIPMKDGKIELIRKSDYDITENGYEKK